MFNGDPGEGGSGAAPGGRQPHGHHRPRPATSTPSADAAAGVAQQLPHAFYAQAPGYQQWLPAQFAGFSIGAYPAAAAQGYPHAGAAHGPPFYAAAAAMPASPVPAGPGADAYLPAMPHLGLPMGLAPDGMTPRGWGGMQLHDQQQQQQQHERGGYGGRRVQGGAVQPRTSMLLPPPQSCHASAPSDPRRAVPIPPLQGRRPGRLPAAWRPRGRAARQPRGRRPPRARPARRRPAARG